MTRILGLREGVLFVMHIFWFYYEKDPLILTNSWSQISPYPPMESTLVTTFYCQVYHVYDNNDDAWQSKWIKWVVFKWSLLILQSRCSPNSIKLSTYRSNLFRSTTGSREKKTVMSRMTRYISYHLLFRSKRMTQQISAWPDA